jgi:hypothetical protein
VREYPESALAVVDFEPATGRVEHVGMRGEATLEPYDRSRAGRLFETYLGDDRGGWPEMFRGLEADEYRSSDSTRRLQWRATSPTRLPPTADGGYRTRSPVRPHAVVRSMRK